MNINMQLVRFAQGVKLIAPGHHQAFQGLNTPKTTMDELFSLPLCVHFTDHQNAIQHISETAAELCGFDSAKDAMGRTLLSVSEKQSALAVMSNCHEVMQTKASKIYEEKVTRRDELLNHCISIKLPWYNDKNKVAGVFGCTAVVGRQPIELLFEKVMSLGVLNSITLNHYTLSKRQEECLRYLVAGHTTREIAALMQLSVRTVEHYLDTVRIKMKCRSRLALVQKAVLMF